MNDSRSLFSGGFDLDSTIEVPQGSVEYDSSLEAYRLQHDWSTDDSLSVSVHSVIEVASKVSTDELPPLYAHINTNALNNLFAPTNSETERARGQVTFPYAGFDVTIDGDGLITVQQIHTEKTQ